MGGIIQNGIRIQIPIREKAVKKIPLAYGINCGRKTFVRYLDKNTGDSFAEQYKGKCDREIKCYYHLNPYGTVTLK